MADKKRIIALCAALVAMVILIILLLSNCGETKVEKPTAPTETVQETQTLEQTEQTEATEETTEATEETTEPTEETEPEETQGSTSGGGNPGGYNPDFGTDDDDDDEDDKKEDTFAAPDPGTQTNPYVEVLAEGASEVSTVKIPVEGVVYYEIHGAANSVLLLENPDASVTCGETKYEPDEKGLISLPIGEGTEPVTIQLSNGGTEEETYKLQFKPPVGSKENPEVLESIDQIKVELAEGDKDGYYYLWKATDFCVLTLKPEKPGYVIQAEHNGRIVSSADSADGTLVMDVLRGIDLLLQVAAVPQEEVYPAISDTIEGIFPEKGTLLNPIEVDPEPQTGPLQLTGEADGFRYYCWLVQQSGTYTVQVDGAEPASEVGITLYGVNSLKKLSEELTAQITQTEETEAPEETTQTEETTETVEPVEAEKTEEAAVAADTEGTTEPVEEETVETMEPVEMQETAEPTESPETAQTDVVLQEQEAQVRPMALESSASIEVKEGQLLVLQVETRPHEEVEESEVKISFSTTFTPMPGLQENPIALKVPEDSVAVPAGESLFFTAQAPGMEMILTGENVSVVVADTEYLPEEGVVRIPCGKEESILVQICNKGETDGLYAVTFAAPEETAAPAVQEEPEQAPDTEAANPEEESSAQEEMESDEETVSGTDAVTQLDLQSESNAESQPEQESTDAGEDASEEGSASAEEDNLGETN